MLDQIFYWTGLVVISLSAFGGLIFFLYWFLTLISYGLFALKKNKFDYINRMYASYFIQYWIEKIEKSPKNAGREFLLKFRDGEVDKEAENNKD